ncbi:hypothetical protein VNO77_04896 [Canavalia gladiata]|uniref:Uncharacterized protein n=1 Tax=Canavalia gladiata TaxID=3824 RepID=A0AAN9MXE0_CANGL
MATIKYHNGRYSDGQERGVQSEIVPTPFVMNVADESLLMGLRELVVSGGSANTSNNLEPSYLLRVLKVDENMIHMSSF